MQQYLQKILAFLITLLVTLIAFSPISGTTLKSSPETSTEEQELHLLRNEHYLYVNASEAVNTFHIWFSYPPDYHYQVPIYLEIFNDTTDKLLHYQIEDDNNPPNKLINFTIGPMEAEESILLHFTCWVLVKNHDFSDLPPYVKIPRRYQLPEDTRIWLRSSKVVQTHSILIKHKARQLRGFSNNLIRYAERIAPFIKRHRYGLFLIQLTFVLFLSQDARTTLLINGENVGRSHLACALFRIYNIPARVLLVHNDQGFWTQMHYMVEYYCPGYGWVLVETTGGKTPYETKRQIINRICYPEDERDTKRDYIFRFMKGEERWLWIENDHVTPYYLDCDTGSKSQMFSEAVTSTDELTANYAFVLTQIVFRYYQQYLGADLEGEDLQHYQNATQNQTQAIQKLIHTLDIEQYSQYMDIAFEEFQAINT